MLAALFSVVPLFRVSSLPSDTSELVLLRAAVRERAAVANLLTVKPQEMHAAQALAWLRKHVCLRDDDAEGADVGDCALFISQH